MTAVPTEFPAGRRFGDRFGDVVAVRRLGSAAAPVAAGAYLLSGVSVAWGHWASAHYLADAAAVQIGCLVALASVTAGPDCAGWSPWLTRRPARRAGPLPEPATGQVASEHLVDSAGS